MSRKTGLITGNGDARGLFRINHIALPAPSLSREILMANPIRRRRCESDWLILLVGSLMWS